MSRNKNHHRSRGKQKWETLCKRTNNPKLAWLERKLADAGIASRRNGRSFYAPILEVQEADYSAACDILNKVDNIPDDHPQFKLP